MSSKSHMSVRGSWLGNYYYAQISQPCAFEAVFAEQDGVVDGSILDDGALGEAIVVGSFAYPSLSFQKRYNNTSLAPIFYEGLLSDDGKRLSGSWRISSECQGSWVAWRLDGEELPAELETEGEKEEVTNTLTAGVSSGRRG